MFTLSDSITVAATLTGGTFDLFDGHCDGQKGLHTHSARERNVCDGVAWCEQTLKIHPCDVMFLEYGVNGPAETFITRMHSSVMRTARCSGRLSCHACLPPHTHPAIHAPLPPPCMSPTIQAPLAMHAPCHAHPLPCMPPAMYEPLCHTRPPAIQALLPCMPPVDRQTPAKTLPSQTSFANGNNFSIYIAFRLRCTDLKYPTEQVDGWALCLYAMGIVSPGRLRYYSLMSGCSQKWYHYHLGIWMTSEGKGLRYVSSSKGRYFTNVT